MLGRAAMTCHIRDLGSKLPMSFFVTMSDERSESNTTENYAEADNPAWKLSEADVDCDPGARFALGGSVLVHADDSIEGLRWEWNVVR